MTYRHLIIFTLLAAFAGCGQPESSAVEVHRQAPGMHCGGCTSTVEETLAKMDGVDSVYAALESKDVLVVVDTTLTSREELESMIEQLGFADAPADGQ